MKLYEGLGNRHGASLVTCDIHSYHCHDSGWNLPLPMSRPSSWNALTNTNTVFKIRMFEDEDGAQSS